MKSLVAVSAHRRWMARSPRTITLTLALLVAFVPARTVLAQGAAPLASYAFSETTGIAVGDASGHENTATLSNGVAHVAGQAGHGVLVQTANDYVLLPTSDTLRLTTAGTFEAWVKPGANPNAQGIWFQGWSESYLMLDDSLAPIFSVALSDGGVWVGGPAALPANAWSHVAVTFDGATVRLYVNAVEVDNAAGTGTWPATTWGGFLGNAGGVRLSGTLDEVRIYGRALSATELAVDMSTPVDAATTPFQLSLTTPATGAVGVTTMPIAASFSQSLNAATLTTSTFELLDGSQTLVTAEVSYDAITHTATLVPATALAPLTTYTARLIGGTTGVMAANGSMLPGDASWTFRTASSRNGLLTGYAFSETTGTIAVDASGNGNAATLSDGVGHVAAQVGNGVMFPTANDRVLLPTSETLRLTTAATFEAWVKPSANPNWQGIWFQGWSESYLMLDERLAPVFSVALSDGGVWVGAADGLPANTWSHLAVTYDGTTVRLYVNGAQVDSAAGTGTWPATAWGGFLGNAGGVRLSGVLDEVRIYGRALSADDIAVDITTPLDTTGLIPSVSIQLADPPGGTTFTQPAAIPVRATVAVTNGAVTSVAFFADGAPIGSAAAPYQIVWSSPSIGPHVLTAVATDNIGHTTASAPVTVTVVAATPPIVTLTMMSPFPGTTFVQPASIAVGATATVANGTIARVDFFAGSTLVGSAPGSPYQIAWSSPAAGAYALTAAAIDNLGGTTTSLPVAIIVSASGSGFGTLGAPIATPSGGIAGPNQPITLTAAPGATIRYTTGGSTPTESSPIYSAPITLAQNASIKAQAFEDGWTPSAVMQEAYQIDGVPPTITATVSPAPNPAGWNNSDVTVSFTCNDAASGVALCPSDIVIASEGDNQSVSGTARDAAGNESTVTVHVSLDKTPPAITADVPADPVETSSSSFSFSASVSDARSGIDDATCNGATVNAAQGTVTCAIPLKPGYNQLSVHVLDVAGNGTSRAFLIKRTGNPTSLLVSPPKRTVSSGETRPFLVVDDSGTPVSGLALTSSDSSVVSVSTLADGSWTITGQAAGDATITARTSQASAAGIVHVVASLSGAPLPSGTIEWQMSPEQNVWPMYRHYQGSGAQILMWGWTSDYTGMYVSGMGPQGEQLWTENLPDMGFGPMFADVFGGAVGIRYLTVPAGYQLVTGLARFAGPGDGTPWEYRSPKIDSVYQYAPIEAPVQAPDGTIYFLEHDYYDSSAGPADPPPGYPRSDSLVALNGQTGNLLYRAKFPQSFYGYGPNCSWLTAPGTTSLVVGSDGAAYVGIMTSHIGCGWSMGFSSDLSMGGDALLMRATANGYTLQDIHKFSTNYVCSTDGCQPTDPNAYYVTLDKLTPDASGGLLLDSADNPLGEGHAGGGRLRRRQPDGSIVDGPSISFYPVITTTAGTALGLLDGTYASIDVATGTTKTSFALHDTEQIVDALADDEWNVYDSDTHVLTRFGSDGQRIAAETILNMDSIKQVQDDRLDGYINDEDGNRFFGRVAVTSQGIRTYYSRNNGGNLEGQGGPEMPLIAMYAPIDDYQSRGIIPFLARDAAQLFEEAADKSRVKTSANVESDATLLFIPASGSAVDMKSSFLDIVTHREAKVVAFLGHALEGVENGPSMGLWFFDLDLVKKRAQGTYTNWHRVYQPIPGKTEQESIEIATRNALPYAYPVDVIRGLPQFVFIGTCFVGPEFLSLWGIDENSTDRVLVVPEGQTTADLYVAARYAWPAFVKALSSGETVGTAIQKATDSCPKATDTNPNGCKAPITWKRIGGSDDMRLLPKK